MALVSEKWDTAIALGLALAVAGLFIFPIFMAIELRWWLEGIRFGPVFATSDLSIGTVLKVYFKTILFVMIYSAVGGMIVAMVLGIIGGAVFISMGGSFEGQAAAAAPSIPVVVAGAVVGGLFYLAFFLGFDLVRRLFFDRGLWAAAVNSVSLSNLAALDQVVAAGGEVPGGVGEGLLDALDFGGGV